MVRDNLWVGQIGLFARAELATMRDRTRRRNYSAEAEEFRREHARHREWGLTQRHARKLSRLYGSTANAVAVFQGCADELISASCSARAAASTSSEPVGPEPPASAPALSEPIRPKAIRSEQAEPEPEQAGPEQAESEQAESEQAESEQAESEQAEPEQAEPEQAEPECVQGAARASGPSGSGNASRCPDRRFRSGRPGRCRPGRPGRHPGPARKGTHRPDRPELARHIHPRTDTESAKSQARRHAGTTGVMNARQRRGTPRSPRPGRTTFSIPRNRREHIPP